MQVPTVLSRLTHLARSYQKLPTASVLKANALLRCGVEMRLRPCALACLAWLSAALSAFGRLYRPSHTLPCPDMPHCQATPESCQCTVPYRIDVHPRALPITLHSLFRSCRREYRVIHLQPHSSLKYLWTFLIHVPMPPALST